MTPDIYSCFFVLIFSPAVGDLLEMTPTFFVGSRSGSKTFVLSTFSADIFLIIHHVNNVVVKIQKTPAYADKFHSFFFFTYSDYFWPGCFFALSTCCSPSVKVTDWYPACWPVIHPDKPPVCEKPVSKRGFLQITSVWVSLCFQQHFSFVVFFSLIELEGNSIPGVWTKRPPFWDVFLKWFKD